MSQKTTRVAARNQTLGAIPTGRGRPGGVGRGALARAAGTLGSPSSLGGLAGSPLAASGGFGAKRTARPGAVGALGASGGRGPPSNLRPSPGRGVNALLATAGTNHRLASARLDSLRGKLR